MPDAVAVAVFAKAPVAGYAKTRLIPRLGAEGAAALQNVLIDRAVATALAARIGPVALWCAPDAKHPCFQEAARRSKPRGGSGDVSTWRSRAATRFCPSWRV